MDNRQFYNDLTVSRMARYHTESNKRVEMACDFVLEHLQPSDRVFELGCGVGVLTKRIAARLDSSGWLYAVDLSDGAVEVARQHVPVQPNVRIECADVLDPDWRRFFVAQPTVVVIPDTLEHLPLDAQVSLFRWLGRIASPTAQILITLPSPEYQSYLANHNPGELQPIDLTITAADLEDLAQAFGGRLVSYDVVDCWRSRQYVHARIIRS